MMYQSKLVASLKANGRVLREHKDIVYLKFGSEYSILLKNLNTVRAIVNVYIDGDNQTPGGLVLNAGQEVDLERSIKNGNLTEGNRFKFIERTGAVEKHRGIKLEDGVIRIEYQFEVYRPVVNAIPNWNSSPIIGSLGSKSATYNVNGVLRSVDFSKGDTMRAMASASTDAYCSTNNIGAQSMNSHDGMATMDWHDAGITVPGSKSTQQFHTTTIGALEPQVNSIVLKILGETPDNEPVRNPITTKHKPKCVTCGKQNKATSKFCTECGTSLEIFS